MRKPKLRYSSKDSSTEKLKIKAVFLDSKMASDGSSRKERAFRSESARWFTQQDPNLSLIQHCVHREEGMKLWCK